VDASVYGRKAPTARTTLAGRTLRCSSVTTATAKTGRLHTVFDHSAPHSGVASPFEILGVDPNAEETEIVDAYRERVKETHPDQGGSAEAFQAVKDAYERIEDGYEPGDEFEDPTAETGGDGSVDAASEPTDPPEPDGVRVEYLNYEIIERRTWELNDADLFEKAADGGLAPEATVLSTSVTTSRCLKPPSGRATRGPSPAVAGPVPTAPSPSSRGRCPRRPVTSSPRSSTTAGFVSPVSSRPKPTRKLFSTSRISRRCRTCYCRRAISTSPPPRTETVSTAGRSCAGRERVALRESGECRPTQEYPAREHPWPPAAIFPLFLPERSE